MPQVSKYPIPKEIADRIFEVFIKTLTSTKDKKEADDFASDLLSPTERVMLAKRVGIAFLLLKGYQYRQISRILRVSLATIASVNISLKHGHEGYKRVLSRITKEEKLEVFFEEMIEKFLSVPASAHKGGGVWRYLKEEVRKKREKKRRLF